MQNKMGIKFHLAWPDQMHPLMLGQAKLGNYTLRVNFYPVTDRSAK